MLAILLGFVVIACGGSGCGATGTKQDLASASTTLRTSQAFKDEFDAQIGTNGRSLFMFVNGSRGGKGVWSRVLRLEGGRWKPASPIWPSTTDSGLYMAFRQTPNGRLPCVGDTGRNKLARIQCLGPVGWKQVSLPRNTPWQYLLQGMSVVNGQIVVPLNKIEKTGNPKSRFRSVTKLARLSGTRLIQQGPLLRTNKQSVSKLETTTMRSSVSQPLRLGVTTQSDPTQQRIATLTKTGWIRSPRLPPPSWSEVAHGSGQQFKCHVRPDLRDSIGHQSGVQSLRLQKRRRW